MASKLSVIFFIVLCLEVGIVLTFLPWIHPFGLSDWGDNYLLLYAARKTGLTGLQNAMSSGWVRGAVSGLGILNLLMAFWEMAHFNQTVRYLQGQGNQPDTKKDVAQSAPATTQLSHHERRDDTSQHPGQ
ncbi:MAG: hypothetical protein ICV68_09550 [Pyrinomonadaceae bacterium]|nr:hypothetical protein [Pyrinomonadaceae bacterium]